MQHQIMRFSYYFTHPGVSGLLKLLSNGLIRGHDNKHLDDHVEDGHGHQVGDVVPVEKENHVQQRVRSQLCFPEQDHACRGHTCLPCCNPGCSRSWGARSRTPPSQWGAWRTRRRRTARWRQPEWWRSSTAAWSLTTTRASLSIQKSRLSLTSKISNRECLRWWTSSISKDICVNKRGFVSFCF